MHQDNGQIRLGAADLVGDLACQHLTQLNLDVAWGKLDASFHASRLLKQLRERGLAHERAYIEHLQSSGNQIVEIAGVGFDDVSHAATVDAMRGAAEIIYQGALGDERWGGRPDILRRVDQPSEFGDWSYEVVDTKLARETKIGTMLQLCLYSDLLTDIQGVQPEHMYVVAPWTEFEPQVYRVQEYAAYFRVVRTHLESALDDGGRELAYPDPKPHCDICRWSHSCAARRRRDDHLSLVAGISRLQIAELSGRELDTMQALAQTPLPIRWKPRRGAVASYERVREQARLQVAGREQGRPVYEPLPIEPEAGLAALPEPSDGDIFLDFEGAPFVGPTGLEYLIGYSTIASPGKLNYAALWALNYEEEKRNFERFVDFVMERLRRYPDLHIYHYAHYEPSAMKRLMGRHATREDEVDRLLRAGIFVDLYRVVRRGLRISAEGYSIKDLEAFFGYERDVPLTDANEALYAVTAPLELGDPDAISQTDLDAVEGYNRDDCDSTYSLREWLETIREELILRGEPLSRPSLGDGAPSQRISEQQSVVESLRERLTADVPADASERSGEQQARWLLASELEFHRREDKAKWWEFFRLHGCTPEELFDEGSAFVQLEYEGRAQGARSAGGHRYRMPQQEVSVRGGEELYVPGETMSNIGTLAEVDPAGTAIEIRKKPAYQDWHPDALIAVTNVRNDVLENSLLCIADDAAQSGFGSATDYPAAANLLLRNPPRTGRGPLRRSDESALDAACRIVRRDNFGVLPIQGPPGSGKTYTGAKMIAEIIKQGRRVGITANSHRVIVNLLDAAYEAADKLDVELDAVRKISPRSRGEFDGSRTYLTEKNPEVFAALNAGCNLAAGTAWLWARPEAYGSVDVLFVDEAAQMSLANVLAISHAAPNVVLLGDPQQLDQPLQGTHPDGADVSALGYLLGERETIAEDRGLFLEHTWRLHPEICAFTSELFYENKLSSRSGLEQQCVISPSPLTGSGLRYLPSPHSGNQNSSDEEAAAISALVRSLIESDSRWINQHGEGRPLTIDDILIIAPYNAQVHKIRSALPNGARVGTVDRFQGQEAPIVIYSMSTSTPADAPRGMDFLYSLNRLNVATSRARCLCLLVGSPALFQPECRSPQQMRLANAFCRYLELAEEIAL